MRKRNSRTICTSRPSSKSKCSATDPASEFSIGITAPSTVPRLTRSKTSSERAHGTTVDRGGMVSAASGLNEPSSPWIAIFIDSFPLLRNSSLKNQLFRHGQCIQLARIVTGNRLFGDISFLFVETNRGVVIHRSLQRDDECSGTPKFFFRREQQSRTDACSPRLSDH